MLDTAESLRDVTAQQWDKMKIPIAIVTRIRERLGANQLVSEEIRFFKETLDKILLNTLSVQ